MKILIVGGGTAGLIAALILKTKFNHKQIDIVASKQLGTIGVGEGSTEHWKEFMKFVGLDQYEVITETDSALKYGVIFENWADKTFYHSVQTPYSTKYGQYRAIYAKLIGEGADPKEFSSKQVQENLIDERFSNDSEKFPCNQFNFNTFKLIDYLTKVCKSRGINVIDDIIEDVQLDEQGNINKLVGKEQTYEYDFYIDSTGFRRILMTKLGAKWQSYSKYLKMKSALVFPTPAEETIPLWILARAMDYGWMFRTPIWNRWGNGYIFDSDYITPDQAKQEIDQYFGKDIQIGNHLKFDPGVLDRVWIKNCCAVGLSGSFVEPLEASSIGSTIHQMFLLMHRLENYDQDIIDSYNKSCNDMFVNIRDYIILHYITKKTNTEFWKDVSNIELPESLSIKLNRWRNHMPIQEDFSGLSDYIMYNDVNHILIMQGLGLFNTEQIKKEYEACSSIMKQDVENIFAYRRHEELTSKQITHREHLTRIRKGK